MKEQEFTGLVNKYLAGKATDKEKEQLEQWDARFDTIPDSFLSAATQQETGERLFRAIEATKHKAVVTRLWYRIAAAAVFAGLLLAGWLYTQQDRVPQEPVYAEIRTGIGQQKTIQLPDGSIVVLNAASMLRFPATFNGNSRLVSLEGEAFFTIQAKPGQPFKVLAGGLTTTVLGTSFNINAYAHRPSIKVGLATGKIQVEDSARLLGSLLSGNELEYYTATHTSNMQAAVVNDIGIWQSGALVFKQATLEEVAFTIEKKYGVLLRFENKAAASCRITSRFQRNTTLKEVLDIITALHQMKYTLQGNTARISGKGCNHF